MILVDTSVWVDHLRVGERALAELLDSGQVLTHPFVIGEVALGVLRRRNLIVDSLQNLPCSAVATDQEVLGFIEAHALYGQGIGYVDAHLLAAVRLTSDTTMWTRDKRLNRNAVRFGLAADGLR